MCNSDSCTVIAAGDFTGLDTFFSEQEFGLTQRVHEVTHAQNILDKFFCSHPFQYKIAVFESCLETKHRAILATGYHRHGNTGTRKKFVVFDLGDSNIHTLHHCINSCSWDNVYGCIDTNVKFYNFVNKTNRL